MIDLSSHTGRWVATSDERLLAAEDSAVEVYRRARQLEPAENFLIHYVEDPAGERLLLPPLLEQIRQALTKDAVPVYLVGGVVRDALLGRNSNDLDFVVPHKAIPLTFRLADAIGAPAYVLDAERDTGRIVVQPEQMTLDIARYRGPDLLADLHDRDFTINSMALPATARSPQAIIDPTNGLADLEAGLIRLARPDALERDPVRALRAIRLAYELDFTLTPQTEEAVMAAASGLELVSAERIRDEILKIVRSPSVDQAIAQLDTLGLLEKVLPELVPLAEIEQSPPHHEAVLSHTYSVLRWLEKIEQGLLLDQPVTDPAIEQAGHTLAPYLESLKQHADRAVDGGLDGRTVLRLVALFHDVGKQSTKTVDENGRIRFFGHAEAGAELAARRLRQLCLSNDAVAQIARIVAEHMRPLLLTQSQGATPSRRSAYRYFKSAGDNGLDVGLLAMADHLATHNGPGDEEEWLALVNLVAGLYGFYFDQYDEAVKPPPLVSGRDLMEQLDLPPGPEIGRLLRLIEEAQAAGELESREEALHFAETHRN